MTLSTVIWALPQSVINQENVPQTNQSDGCSSSTEIPPFQLCLGLCPVDKTNQHTATLFHKLCKVPFGRVSSPAFLWGDLMAYLAWRKAETQFDEFLGIVCSCLYLGRISMVINKCGQSSVGMVSSCLPPLTCSSLLLSISQLFLI